MAFPEYMILHIDLSYFLSRSGSISWVWCLETSLFRQLKYVNEELWDNSLFFLFQVPLSLLFFSQLQMLQIEKTWRKGLKLTKIITSIDIDKHKQKIILRIFSLKLWVKPAFIL